MRCALICLFAASLFSCLFSSYFQIHALAKYETKIFVGTFNLVIESNAEDFLPENSDINKIE